MRRRLAGLTVLAWPRRRPWAAGSRSDRPWHGRHRAAGLACAGTWPRTPGSTSRGDYGAVFAEPDSKGDLMQQNMGNGAAVGDYNGDGWLDVLLLGQAGHPTRLFRNDPAPGGTRHFTDVTEAAGLGGVTSNARVAQFVDLNGSGRPDLVIAADYLPGGPGGPSQIFANTATARSRDVTAGSASTRRATSWAA